MGLCICAASGGYWYGMKTQMLEMAFEPLPEIVETLQHAVQEPRGVYLCCSSTEVRRPRGATDKKISPALLKAKYQLYAPVWGQELVEGGDRVVICGRDEKRLTAAAAALKARARGQGAVYAIRCDVSNGHGAPPPPPRALAPARPREGVQLLQSFW